MQRIYYFVTALLTLISLSSCGSSKLMVTSVGYHSVRTTFAKPTAIPDTALIAVEYFISPTGELLGVVFNLTDEIVTIDQTKSFVVNTNGNSVSYFDPTVYTSTSGSYTSSTTSQTLNLGAIAGVFGIGGSLGSILGGISVGEANTTGSYGSNTVTIADQPLVRIGPKGKIALSKQYVIEGLGRSGLSDSFVNSNFNDAGPKNSPLQFKSTVSFTVGEDETIQKLTTDFYVSSRIVEPVEKGRVGASFRKIYDVKPDALAEPTFLFVINDNLPKKVGLDYFGELINVHDIYDTYARGSLIDFK